MAWQKRQIQIPSLSVTFLNGNLMLSWFDARDAQQFGGALADFYVERVPADTDFQGQSQAQPIQKSQAGKFLQMKIVGLRLPARRCRRINEDNTDQILIFCAPR
jgi:hypothetical protein